MFAYHGQDQPLSVAPYRTHCLADGMAAHMHTKLCYLLSAAGQHELVCVCVCVMLVLLTYQKMIASSASRSPRGQGHAHVLWTAHVLACTCMQKYMQKCLDHEQSDFTLHVR
jgi:hypothetical protein